MAPSSVPVCVQLIRSNGTRRVLTSATNYDAGGQPYDIFTPAIDLFPGDRILTTCIYDSTNSSSDVVWGESTRDEMCYGLLYYYPAFDTKINGVCSNLHGRLLDIISSRWDT